MNLQSAMWMAGDCRMTERDSLLKAHGWVDIYASHLRPGVQQTATLEDHPAQPPPPRHPARQCNTCGSQVRSSQACRNPNPNIKRELAKARMPLYHPRRSHLQRIPRI